MLTPTTLIALGILALLLVLMGSIVGWVLADSPIVETKSKLKALVAIAVTAVWIVSTIADIVITGYAMSPLIHALMGGLVGYFFTDDGLQFNIGRK